MSANAKRRPLSRLLRHARAHRGRIALASLCSVLNKLFDLAPPFLIGVAIDVVVERESSIVADLGVATDPQAQLVWLAAVTLLVWGLESLFQYLHGILWRNLAQTIQHELRLEAYGHVQRLDMAWFEEGSTGSVMAVLNDDVNQLERFLDHGANDLIQVATTALAISVAFFVMAPEVAALAMLPIPVILWGSFLFQRRIAPRYATVRERVGLLNDQLAGGLGGIATVKSFTNEDAEVERIRVLSDDYRQANRRAIRLSAAFTPLIRMIVVLGFIATLVYGGAKVLAGSLSPATFAVMTFLTQRLLWPLTRLGETFDLYQRAMASTTRILNLVETPARIVGGPVELASGEATGAIRLAGVHFRYPTSRSVLDGVDVEIAAGQTVAFVGPTGAGKTTLVKLLLRFHDPTEGRVLLDGHDLRALTLPSVRRAIGLVSQDVFLFHGSVRENVAYGRADATFDELVEAARVAEALPFIEQLAHGWETIVGERGQKLSGGQRQRLSIARAVLKDPPVLVLDEATSSVDNETEAAIQRSLATIAVGRTTILIAHRLSTVRHADAIHVLDAGRVVESGRHETLLAQDGLYAALWRVQTGERADELERSERVR